MRPTSPPVTRPRSNRRALTAEHQPSTLARPCRPSSMRPALKNRRYAAVLSNLNRQTGASSQPSLSSSVFSGYVPKCKQNSSGVHCSNAPVVTSVSAGSTEQRRTKVSFCLQTSHSDTLCERGTTTSSSSSCIIAASCSSAAFVTSALVTCSNNTPTSVTVSVPSQTTVSSPKLHVADGAGDEMSADCSDNSDISLLCAELFVDNNASFCDKLLDSCSLPYTQPETPNVIVPHGSSFNSKHDIPEPITDLTFDDFVELDELFSCN